MMRHMPMGHKSGLWAISQKWSALCSNTSHILSKYPPFIRDSSLFSKQAELCRERLLARRSVCTGPQAAADLLGLKALFSNPGSQHGACLQRHSAQHFVSAQNGWRDGFKRPVQGFTYRALPGIGQPQEVDFIRHKFSAQGQVVRFSSSSTSWMQRVQAQWQALGGGAKKAEGELPGPTSSGTAVNAAEEAKAAATTGLLQSAVDVGKGRAGPFASIRATAVRYREVAGLQVESFLRHNWIPIVGVVGVGTAFLLWRFMFRVASLFVTISEGMAYWGFLSLSASIVTFVGLLLRRLYTINPDAVYRTIMRQLNSSAAALEVVGAPLAGTDLRAYVMSGGGVRFKHLWPRLATKRCFLVFPVRGSDRRALVSAEVKKKNGKYHFKLLALDVPTALAGQEQRVFLVGDQAAYKKAGGLISELRDPLLEALKRQKEFEIEDDREDEEEARLQREEQQRKAEEAAAKQREKEEEERAHGLK